MLHTHFIGAPLAAGFAQSRREWRRRCAEQAVARELPPLAHHLAESGVHLDDFLPAWFGTVFMCTLSLDACARLWDCYLRDGEAFLWRAALELLRLLAPRLLEAEDRPACLQLLRRAHAVGGVTERSLFHSLDAHEGGVGALLRAFGQKLPMPTLAHGVCYDLWLNSVAAEQQAAALEASCTLLRDSERDDAEADAGLRSGGRSEQGGDAGEAAEGTSPISLRVGAREQPGACAVQ
jgi:hypothetical protein